MSSLLRFVPLGAAHVPQPDLAARPAAVAGVRGVGEPQAGDTMALGRGVSGRTEIQQLSIHPTPH